MAGSFYFNPESTGLGVFLGTTESELMKLAWEKKSLTVKKAMFFLGSKSTRAYTTVMTVLNRLAKKGLLTRQKTGRSYTYIPTCDEQTFLKNQVNVVMECLNRNFKDMI